MAQLTRRSMLGALGALPALGLAAGTAAPGHAVGNSTTGFGRLLKQVKGTDVTTAYPTAEYSAKIYEHGISVTRRGLTMSRRSAYDLAKRWQPAHGFPVGHVHRNSLGTLIQDFGGTHMLYPDGNYTVVGRGPGYNKKVSPFTDVPTDHWFYGPIAGLNSLGVIRGWPDGTFRPDAPVLRDAFAAFCYRLAGSPAYAPPRISPFVDVSPRLDFYKEICWLRATNVSRGWPDGTYRPFEPIKRDAIAAMLYRLAPPSAFSFVPESTSGFADVTRSTIFFQEIAWMRATGIAQGWVRDSRKPVKDQTFDYRPLTPATRADTAAFMIRWWLLFADS